MTFAGTEQQVEEQEPEELGICNVLGATGEVERAVEDGRLISDDFSI